VAVLLEMLAVPLVRVDEPGIFRPSRGKPRQDATDHPRRDRPSLLVLSLLLNERHKRDKLLLGFEDGRVGVVEHSAKDGQI
jgi:hypothetical protein